MSVVMQYAPYTLAEGAWDDAKREALADTVMSTLEQYAPGLAATILHRQLLTPLDLEADFGLTEGSGYHGELTLDQILFMRPVAGSAHYRGPLAGLYLCGAGTHPGGGITGMPGRLAAREVLRDAKR
jgi:phytoene dehydrogenase-like protein